MRPGTLSFTSSAVDYAFEVRRHGARSRPRLLLVHNPQATAANFSPIFQAQIASSIGMTRIGLTKWTVFGVGLALVATVAAGTTWHEFTAVQPAQSHRLLTWERTASSASQRGAALFSYGDFGALDLDTLATSAVPWPLLAASLALLEAQGRADLTAWAQVESAFKRFGFLYPEKLGGLSGAVPADGAPLGLSIGTVTRAMPPLRMDVLNIGCAACHAGPAYRADGTPDLAHAVPGMPNTSLDLEAFTTTSYAAFKRALADEASLMAAIERLFPQNGAARKADPALARAAARQSRDRKAHARIDRPLPFPNGTPGSTNGVAALKHQLHVTPRDRFNEGAGFVSIPVLADRFWRSALLVDGAYAPKDQVRFRADWERRGQGARSAGACRRRVILHGAQHGHVGCAGRGRDPGIDRGHALVARFHAAAVSRPDRSFARGGGPRGLRACLRVMSWRLRCEVSTVRGCRAFPTGRAMSERIARVSRRSRRRSTEP